MANNVRSIRFEDSMVLVRRAKIPRKKPFERILVGSIELVTQFDRNEVNDKWYEDISGL